MEKNKMKSQRNGAETIIECLKREGVEYIFGYPGGAVIPILDAVLNCGIKFILTRHEQGAIHIADGYARATGKPGVALVTSGPGATNAITGLLTAYTDSVPVIVLCGQTITPFLGKDAFQEADIFGISMPVVKHSYLLKDVNSIPRIFKEAFYLASSGRPGPVLIDIPKDIATTPCTADFTDEIDLPGYSFVEKPNTALIIKAVEALSKALKPLLLIGHGCIISDAGKELKALAEKLQIPIVTTLLGKGAIPENHELCFGMLGMHGTAYANKAVLECDLIFSIGSRWDDRITGKLSEFCSKAFKIHADIDPAEFGKVLKPDLFILGDAKHILQELHQHAGRLKTEDWLKTLNKYRKQYPLKYSKQGGLHAQYVIDRIYHLTKGEAIITTGVGQHQMWAAQFCKTHHPRHWISSGGAGTMGFGLPSAIGAQFGKPGKTVVLVDGDGGFQMTCFELSTAAIHKLPIKMVVINNKYLGMVRQWQQLFYDNKLSGVDLEGNPDFVTLAEAYGIKAFRIRRNADVDKILKAALQYNEGPCLIDAEVVKEDNVFPMIPAGAPYSGMLIESPLNKKLDKPTGST